MLRLLLLQCLVLLLVLFFCLFVWLFDWLRLLDFVSHDCEFLVFKQSVGELSCQVFRRVSLSTKSNRLL